MRARTATLLWLVVLAAGLAASLTWFLLPREGERHAADAEARLETLFPVPLEEIAAVEIVAGGRLHRFERDAGGTWLRHGHAHGAATAEHAHRADPQDAARIAAALAMSGRTRIERRLPYEPARRADYGLTYPPLILLLYGNGRARPLLTVETGDLAPDTISRYAFLVEEGALVTIPDYQVANLAELAAAAEAGS